MLLKLAAVQLIKILTMRMAGHQMNLLVFWTNGMQNSGIFMKKTNMKFPFRPADIMYLPMR